MIVNGTCVQTNGTNACSAPSSSAGLAVGLSLFSALLVVGVGWIVFKRHKKIRTLVQSGQSGSQNKTVCAEPQQTEEPHYTRMSREQTKGQAEGHTPIYENLTTPTGYRGPAAKQSRLPDTPEEDLYLQCDPIDEGIYSNEPAFNSMHPDAPGEDLYIVPHS